MTHSNPFVLPGMGQDADLSGNPLLASMEMMRQAWAGLAGSAGLGQSLPLTPLLNPEELERRITELRSVEGWLRMNLQMLGSTIQGLEVQRATIATLRSFVGGAPGASSVAEGAASPLEVVLGIKPAPAQAQTQTQTQPEPAAPAQTPAPDAEAANAAAQSASQAWWDLLNQQFSHLAAATAASLPAVEAMTKAAEQGFQSAVQAQSPVSAGEPGAAEAAARPAGKPTPRATTKTAAKPAAASTARLAAKRTRAPQASKTPRAARGGKSDRAD